jgi:hypothetical protein
LAGVVESLVRHEPAVPDDGRHVDGLLPVSFVVEGDLAGEARMARRPQRFDDLLVVGRSGPGDRVRQDPNGVVFVDGVWAGRDTEPLGEGLGEAGRRRKEGGQRGGGGDEALGGGSGRLDDRGILCAVTAGEAQRQAEVLDLADDEAGLAQVAGEVQRVGPRRLDLGQGGVVVALARLPGVG